MRDHKIIHKKKTIFDDVLTLVFSWFITMATV